MPAGGLFFFVAYTVMNVSNFAFHMVTSRSLVPETYGALGALLSLMLVLQVPVVALQVAITQQVAVHAARSAQGSLARLSPVRVLLQMTAIATFAAVLIVALSPLLKDFLHLDSLTPCFLLALDMFPLLVGLVPRAVFLGAQDFRPVSIALIAGAVVRLGLGYTFGELDYGVNGAMAATVIGDLVMTVLLLAPLRRATTREPLMSALQIRLRDATAAGVAFAGMLLFIGTDTILARHYLPEHASGVYVAAATAARSALFLSAAIGLIFLPRFAAHNGQGVKARQALMNSLSMVIGLGALATLVITLFPEQFITLIFGGKYSEAADLVGLLSAGSAMLGIVTLVVYFQLARRSPSAWFPWLGVGVLGCAIVVFHQSSHTIAKTTVLITATIAIVAFFAAIVRNKGESVLEEAQRHRPPLPTGESEIDLTVVVPFFNPGPNFLPSLERLVQTLREENVSFEVIAVSDGSTDGNAEALQDMNSDVVRSVILEKNWGKGEALRVGFSLGRGRYIGFIDADGDIDASLFHPFLAIIELYHPDIVLGSKRHPMSEVEYPVLRRIYSWGYQQVIRLLFRLDVQDTQTGIKLVRREVLAGVLPRMVERGFAFDLELFVVARHLGYRKMFEAPVRIGTRFTSTVSRRAVLEMFHDTIEIFYRLHILHAYDLEEEPKEFGPPSGAVELG